MKIKSIQKVIKVGSSLAVTIPAKDAQHYGIQAGENIEVQLQRIEARVDDHKTEVVALTQQLIERHQKALDNLCQR